MTAEEMKRTDDLFNKHKIDTTITIDIEDYDYYNETTTRMQQLRKYAKGRKYMSDDIIRLLLGVEYEEPTQVCEEAKEVQ